MAYTEDYLTTADGLRLHVGCWLPAARAKAALVLVHGFTEHIGRYAELAERLNRHGCALYAADLRGHGRSEGEPILILDFDDYVDDLARLLAYVQEKEPDRPRFVFGHSMGGAIVALLAQTRQPDVQGIALSAPALEVNEEIHPFLRRLAHVVGRWLPRFRLVRLGGGTLSRDEEVVQQFRDDPLVYHGRMPTGSASQLLRAGERIVSNAAQTRLPLLILHGTGDRLTTVQGSRQFHDAASSPDKTLKLYEGLYHDLLHEPERHQVMDDLVAWLDDRMNDSQ